MKRLKKIGLGLLVVLIILQFFRIDTSVPEFDPSQDFITQTQAPETMQVILKKACYDCHSYESNYPWYSQIAPVSWWMKDHINEGREHLNFSVWGSYSEKRRNHKLEECWEELEEGEMPMESYLIMHGEAELSAEEKSSFVNWLKTLK